MCNFSLQIPSEVPVLLMRPIKQASHNIHIFFSSTSDWEKNPLRVLEKACVAIPFCDIYQGSGPHLLKYLLMIIDEVAQLKRKTIKTLPGVKSTLLMSGSVPGPALQHRPADCCAKNLMKATPVFNGGRIVEGCR